GRRISGTLAVKDQADGNAAVAKCMQFDHGQRADIGDLHHRRTIILTHHLPVQFFTVQVCPDLADGVQCTSGGCDSEGQDKRDKHLHWHSYRLISCSRTPRAELRFVPIASLAEKKLMIPSERRAPVPNCHSNCGAEAIWQS